MFTSNISTHLFAPSFSPPSVCSQHKGEGLSLKAKRLCTGGTQDMVLGWEDTGHGAGMGRQSMAELLHLSHAMKGLVSCRPHIQRAPSTGSTHGIRGCSQDWC